MLLQCIVRKASGLPVTLLEIHVAMHVICAIGMYGFWLNKPQDVGEPLPVPGTVAGNDPVQLAVEIIGHMSTDSDNEHRYQGRSLYIQLHLDPAQKPTGMYIYPTHAQQSRPSCRGVRILHVLLYVYNMFTPDYTCS